MNNKLSLTALLAVAAGSCDAITFYSGKGFFSAHITGNLILLARDIMVRTDASGWLRLLPFPVFMLAAGLGGYLYRKPGMRNYMLLLEAGILAGAAWLAFVYKNDAGRLGIVMLATLSMGLQNAFQRLFAGMLDGTTTMMTGNIVQSAIDVGSLGSVQGKKLFPKLKKGGWIILAFLVGCFSGMALAEIIQLAALSFSALVVLAAHLVSSTKCRSSPVLKIR